MRLIIFLLFAAAVFSLDAVALSVASDYLENNTLVLIKGDSKIYSIRIQNPTDYDTSIKVDYDSAFMKAIDYKEIYTLPPMTAGYRILFNVTAPEKPGLHRITYTVSEVEPAAGGSLPIRLKINRGFNLRVIEDPNKFRINYDYAAFAVVGGAFLLYVFWKNHKTKKKKRKARKFL